MRALTAAVGTVSAMSALVVATGCLSTGNAPSLVLGGLWAGCAVLYGTVGEEAAREGEEVTAGLGAGIAVGHGLAVVIGAVAALVNYC